MKKRLGKLLLIVAMITSCCACQETATLDYMGEGILDQNFETSLNDAYVSDGEFTYIQLFSCADSVSPLKSIALQNLFDTHNLNMLSYKETENRYRFSIEESLYRGRNCVETQMLSDNSIPADFYDAYYVSERIDDSDLKETIDKKYSQSRLMPEDTMSYEIYQLLNKMHCGQGVDDNTRDNVTQSVYRYIDEIASEKVIDMSFDSLGEMKAALSFLYECKDTTLNDKLIILYDYFTKEDTEKRILLDIDIATVDYFRCVLLMKEMLNEAIESEDFLYQRALEGSLLYHGIVYDITAPRNFAMYILGLCFKEERIDDSMYTCLLQILEQIRLDIDLENDMEKYYYNLAADLLNSNQQVVIEDFSHSKAYFSLLLHREKKDFSELYKKNGDIEELLYACDRSSKSEEKSRLLQKINILEYKNEVEFPMLMNMYVANMKENALMHDQQKIKKIKEYINACRCKYGYANKPNSEAYDFRTSIYYTNILFLLDGGVDCGLR